MVGTSLAFGRPTVPRELLAHLLPVGVAAADVDRNPVDAGDLREHESVEPLGPDDRAVATVRTDEFDEERARRFAVPLIF